MVVGYKGWGAKAKHKVGEKMNSLVVWLNMYQQINFGKIVKTHVQEWMKFHLVPLGGTKKGEHASWSHLGIVGKILFIKMYKSFHLVSIIQGVAGFMLVLQEERL